MRPNYIYFVYILHFYDKRLYIMDHDHRFSILNVASSTKGFGILCVYDLLVQGLSALSCTSRRKLAMLERTLIFSIAFCLLCCSSFKLQLTKIDINRQIAKIISSTLLVSGSLIGSSPAFADLKPAPWDSTVKYEVITEGKGDAAKVSDLTAIRFKGSYKGLVFDDTFKNEQPYFYRAG